MMTKREETKSINVGGVTIGGGAPISVQSMCTTRTEDIEKTLSQINELHGSGCDIIRLAVPNMIAAQAISAIKEKSPIPIVADIHFDHRLAVEAARRGADKIRINPGNIGGVENVAAVAKECSLRGIPIRIGVNSGSIPKGMLERFGGPTPEAMAEAAAMHIGLLNNCDFDDICLSLKSSSVPASIAAYRLAAERFKYPLHIGITESGTPYNGIIRSAVGVGAILSEGIGDTLRVSLTADPAEEVKAAIAILKAAELRTAGPRLISCPTCGRTEIDLIALANEVESRLAHIKRDITVAVMGCVVNGPGEAREADYGIAGGLDCGLIFRRGVPVKRVQMQDLADALIGLIESETKE